MNVDERNEDSYIDPDKFFREKKKPKICQRSIFIFLWFGFCFLFKFNTFVKMKANTTIELKKCNGHEKRDRFESGF